MQPKRQPPATGQLHPLIERAAELQAALARRPALSTAGASGARLETLEDGRSQLILPYWGDLVAISLSDFTPRNAATGAPLSKTQQAMILYYLSTADGAPVEPGWISFAALPDGRFYNQAFQGYTGRELERTFANGLEDFARCAAAAGGERIAHGDTAYAFQPLPRLSLAAAAWAGDDELPPSYQVLFNSSARHYLTTDACAILGSQLVQRILAARERA